METTVNERVNLIIEESGLSVNLFAKKIGVAQTTLKAIVDGDTRPSYSTIEKILIVFPISAEWLVLGAGNKERATNETEVPQNTGNVLKALERFEETLKEMKKENKKLNDKVTALEKGKNYEMGKDENTFGIAAEKPVKYGK